MITESEYLEAKKIVDEYERQQYMEKQGEAEDEFEHGLVVSSALR